MPSITISQITDRLESLPSDKLIVVYEFVSFLAARDKEQTSIAPIDRAVGETVVLPRAEYDRLKARRRRQAAFYDFARNLGQSVEEQGLGEEEFMADLEKTKRKVFAEQYGRSA